MMQFALVFVLLLVLLLGILAQEGVRGARVGSMNR